jgi:hypothetical protein
LGINAYLCFKASEAIWTCLKPKGHYFLKQLLSVTVG